MSVNCLFNLQKAVFAALTGNVDISDNVTGIFTHVPQNTDFPYINIAVLSTQDQSTIETSILEVILEINSYSRLRGTEELSSIMSNIKKALHHKTLVINDCSCLGVHMIDESIDELSDGLTWHSSQRFKIWLQEN